jgi:RNA polymerase sigma factor (sigma-70 family)
MASSQWSVVLRHVERLFHGGGVAGLTEGQLLDRFVNGRDEVAFGALVARHGPMVLGICRGVLDDPHDVEDAFQSTFLVLVRKAGGLRDRERLAQWLYGVARKVALRARADASRRKLREQAGSDRRAEAVATFDAELRELQSMVREEVDRLGANDRMAVVLCYLDGLTHEEAADRLGWPVGTVKGRLARARDRLRDRLVRRGVVLPAAVVTSTLAREASAAVPAELLRSTTLAAIRVAAGESLTAGIVSAHAVALMEGVIGTMFTTKLKLGAAALVASCTIAIPSVLAWQEAAGSRPSADAQKAAGNPQKSSTGRGAVVEFEKAKVDKADARAGREPSVLVAERALQVLDMLRSKGEAAPPEANYLWSRRLLDAQTAAATTPEEKTAALKAYVERLNKLKADAMALHTATKGSFLDVLDAEYRCNEAEKWLADAQAEPPAPTRVGKSSSPGAGRDPKQTGAATFAEEQRNRAILAKLEEPISMNFAQATPFEDVKKYIEQCTQDEKRGFPNGIPIYVDPNGLKLAQTKMADTVTLNLEGLPLRTTLRLMLSQLHLIYKVEDGLLLITNDPGRVIGPGGLQ